MRWLHIRNRSKRNGLNTGEPGQKGGAYSLAPPFFDRGIFGGPYCGVLQSVERLQRVRHRWNPV